MLYIFHGDNHKDSRQHVNQLINSFKESNTLRLDYKKTELETVNNFLQGTTLLSSQKTLLLNNFFSVTKAKNKLIPLIKKSTINTNIIIWQSRKLTATQLKTFPHAKIQFFSLPNYLWGCINAVKPHNLRVFQSLYQKIINQNLYDLFLYLLKNNIRKQISGYSSFSRSQLTKTYLQLIDLDYKNKSGQLTTAKEIVLERILTQLLLV